MQSADNEKLPKAKIFVAEKCRRNEPVLQKWPYPGRATRIANETACLLASHGESATLLDPLGEWQIVTDLEHLVFPIDEVLTTQRPDVVVWSRPFKSLIIVELSVPWEANFEVSHERKMIKYAGLVAQCRQKGWRCELFVVEVGA